MIAERKFTPTNARSFNSASVRSVLQIEDAIRERTASGMHPSCHCQAYRYVLAFDRWKGLGLLVTKGERALKISSWIPVREGNKNASAATQGAPSEVPANVRLKPHTLCLFCRCQVHEKD